MQSSFEESHKSYFFVSGKNLPSGFPKVTKSPTDAKHGNPQFIGSNLTFECDATGGNIEIRWFFRRVPVRFAPAKVGRGEQTKLTTSIANDGRKLTIHNLGKVTLALLECYVVNSVGMDIAGSYKLNSIPVVSKYYSNAIR